MARLPTPGGDDDTWGSILNDYLSVSLEADGTLNPNALPLATSSAEGTIQLAEDLGNTASDPQVVNLHLTSDTSIGHKLTNVTDPTNAQDAATKNYVDNQITGGAPDATSSTPGLVRLTGDFGGTYLDPTVVSTHLASALPVNQGGTGAATLTGLIVGNGTSAFTTVAAPNGTIVGTTDTQTLSNKTISGSSNTLTNIPESAVTNLSTDLAGKTSLAAVTGIAIIFG